jgi:hypothetical protein
MKVAPMTLAMALAGAVSVFGACGLNEDPGRLSCGDWLEVPAQQRLGLTDQIVGTSDEVLGRIRSVTSRGGIDVGTRDGLVRWVEASLTKNCDVWPPRSRSVRETFEALYP